MASILGMLLLARKWRRRRGGSWALMACKEQMEGQEVLQRLANAPWERAHVLWVRLQGDAQLLQAVCQCWAHVLHVRLDCPVHHHLKQFLATLLPAIVLQRQLDAVQVLLHTPEQRTLDMDLQERGTDV